jgi:NAD(P)-dependent dehydrogenase (short-subunit alcohol dehydrogenase family)
MFDLTDRVAFVTGAARGLGQAMAVGLAAWGADVAIADLDVLRLEDTQASIEALGRRAWPLAMDVCDAAAVSAAFERLDKLSPRLDILINNAGISTKARPEDLSLQEWQRTLDTNVTGYFLCAQQAARRMIAAGSGGAIVNISSIAGTLAQGRGSLAYSVSKGAVNQLTRELAIEWARHRIRVNAIQPCQIRTPLLLELMANPNVANLTQRWLEGIPLGRLGEPDDLVGPVVFLVSDAAAMVTGHLLPVDGGNLALDASGSPVW